MSIKTILERFKSPVVWFGLIATLASAAQISPENMTSWPILWDNIVATVSNPFLVAMATVAVFAYINNPETKDKF
jgi:hypothetical protein